MSKLLDAVNLNADYRALLENKDPHRVLAAASKPRKQLADLALLLSPGANSVLEDLAQRANKITQARFGNVVGLYAPLYISNKCNGSCPYCGFKKSSKILRLTLNAADIKKEGEVLYKSGIRHVLLVSGDSPKSATFDLLLESAQILRKIFSSVSVEVVPLEVEHYAELEKVGVDGVTLYQETYNKSMYNQLHAKSPKEDYLFRLNALDRAGKAGIRKLTVGALWGLFPWREDAFALGAHGFYLQKNHWRSQVLIGMPRLHHVPEDFNIPHPVDDRSFLHIIIALRIFLNDAGIVISTRETSKFRDNLIPVGATHFSAGSKTEPGGYSSPKANSEQFSIDDARTPAQVKDDLSKLGYDPVFKDWDDGFLG